MDVIVTDTERKDVAAIMDATFDLDFGVAEGTKNDFTLTFPRSSSMSRIIGKNSLVYLDGTEYGGIVRTMDSKLASRESMVSWTGKTLQGELDEHVLSPDTGQDYLTVDGPAKTVLEDLLNRMGITDLFHVALDCTTRKITYQFERYVNGYAGICKMLEASSLKLHANCNQTGFYLSVLPIETIGDLDSDKIDFESTQDHGSINHLIGLGEGELKNRAVTHWYADKDGNVSQTQTLFGLEEIAATYDYSSSNLEDLKTETEKKLKELQTKGSVDVTLRDTTRNYDIGDVVSAKDMVTGTTVTSKVNRKIAKLDNGIFSISYEVGEASSSTPSLSGSSEISPATFKLTAGKNVTITDSQISADVGLDDVKKATDAAQNALTTATGLSFDITGAKNAATAAATASQKALKVANSSVQSLTVSPPLKVTRDGTDVSLDADKASESADGFMSSADKSKLDGIEPKANKYVLPAATTETLGGVKPDGKTISISPDGTLTAQSSDVEAAFLAAYPVGSVYLTTNKNNPSTKYGGTWEQLPSMGAFAWERIS